jgi:hypothetical protein
LTSSGLGRRLAQILWWISLAVIVGGVALYLLGVDWPVGVWIGGGLIALGLNALLAGELIAGPEPRPFSARAQVVRGVLEVDAGWSDVAVKSGSNDRVASVRYGPLGKPSFEIVEGVAQLRLKHAFWRPTIANWGAELATNILWDIDARSRLGDLTVDLRDLRLDKISARTGMGKLSVIGPTRGAVRLYLRTGAGEIELEVPHGVDAKLRLKRGELSTLTLDEERFQPVGENRYIVTGSGKARASMEVTIETAAGDVCLR